MSAGERGFLAGAAPRLSAHTPHPPAVTAAPRAQTQGAATTRGSGARGRLPGLDAGRWAGAVWSPQLAGSILPSRGPWERCVARYRARGYCLPRR